MSSSYAQALHNAAATGSVDDRVEGLKQVASHQLRQLDSQVQVRSTQYFNSSIAPDLVLTWSDDTVRHVYLRLDEDQARLEAEARQSAPLKDALVYAVSGLDGTADRLSETLVQRGTMLTEPDALAVLQPTVSAPQSGLVSHAVVRGGQGLMAEESASELSAGATSGFEAAQTLDAHGAATALATLRSHLKASEAGRLERVYRAVWQAHGGRDTEFPEGIAIGSLSTPDLEYLLKVVSTNDQEFWTGIGSNLELSQLVQLRRVSDRPGYQPLAQAASEWALAKAIRVCTREGSLFDRPGSWKWAPLGSCLVLATDDLEIHLAPDRVEELPSANSEYLNTLGDGLERYANKGLELVEVTVAGDARASSMTWKALSGGVHEQDDDLRNLRGRDLLGATLARSGSMPQLVIDYERRSIAGHTSARTKASDLIDLATALLTDLDEVPGVATVEAPIVDASDQPSLF